MKRSTASLLDHLDKEVDGASSAMGFVQAKLAKLLKTKDGCQIWTIVILTVTLIIISNAIHTLLLNFPCVTLTNSVFVVALLIWT